VKLLLVGVNARWTHSNLALRCLRGAAEAGFSRSADPASHSVELREYEINQGRLSIVRDIAAAAPDAVAISVYIWNSSLVASILPDLRALLPRARLVVGGPEVSYRAEAWLERCPDTDLVVTGPGEGAVEDLAAAGFSRDPGTGRILAGRPVDFPSSPFPYRDTDWPGLAGRYLYYESSRGCPFSCSYCLSSRSDQAQVFKDVATVMDELSAVVAGGPFLVKFVDRSFNADPARARELWRLIILRWADAGCRFHFEVHPGLLSGPDYAVLANAPAGLFQFELGVQTVHGATRSIIRRGGDWERERTAIRALAGLGTVHLHLDLIAGLPGEGMAELGASFDEAIALGADHLQLGFLKGLPGTELRERAAGFGAVFQADPPYEVLRTDALDSGELSLLSGIATLVDGLANRQEFRETLARAYATAGSPFAAFRSMAGYCGLAGFDARTRDRAKLAAMLEGFLSGRA